MQFNSKIYLRGKKEPILVPENRANKIKELFLNPEIEAMTTIDAGNLSFLKENIKMIEVEPDTLERDIKIPHWIIRHKVRNSIWQKPYLTENEAKMEFDFREMKDEWEIIKM